ncbi:MAG TPA: hypothetical protein VGI75_15030, partial [Pirellulales bacterium]
HHPPDLVKAINATDGKEVSLKIMRAGKEQTIAVQPTERPQNNNVQVFGRPSAGMMFGGAGGPPKIPDNMTISIVRQGGKPAKITVTRGDDKWDVTEGELDKLPEDVRPIVQGTLGGGPMTIRLPGGMNILGMQDDGHGPQETNRQLFQMFGQHHDDFRPNPPPPGDGERRDGDRHDGERRGPPDGNAGPGPGPDLMHRLDEIDRHLQRLEDELHGMRGGPNSTRDGGPPDGRPRVRPAGRPPMGDDGAQGPPPNGERRGPPGPPDGERRGPPPGGERRGSPDGDRKGPPPVE